jgi:hypothetical protein
MLFFHMMISQKMKSSMILKIPSKFWYASTQGTLLGRSWVLLQPLMGIAPFILISALSSGDGVFLQGHFVLANATIWIGIESLAVLTRKIYFLEKKGLIDTSYKNLKELLLTRIGVWIITLPQVVMFFILTIVVSGLSKGSLPSLKFQLSLVSSIIVAIPISLVLHSVLLRILPLIPDIRFLVSPLFRVIYILGLGLFYFDGIGLIGKAQFLNPFMFPCALFGLLEGQYPTRLVIYSFVSHVSFIIALLFSLYFVSGASKKFSTNVEFLD